MIWAAVLPTAFLGGAMADERLEVDSAKREAMALCTDGKSHYIAIAPNEKLRHELYYGDGKRFFLVGGQPPPRTILGLNFHDPRLVSKTGNPDFRGIDVRQYSEVQYEPDKKTCAVRCGDRVTPLSIVDAQKAQPLLKAAAFEPSPQKYEPYALVRDDLGNYYYVDRGATAQKERSFRLYSGTRGNMKLLKMTNVVSDSEGDIFATPNGSLRLILAKHESAWVENAKSRKLTIVPWEQNLRMIYNELGVYTGQRLGTPCDDL